MRDASYPLDHTGPLIPFCFCKSKTQFSWKAVLLLSNWAGWPMWCEYDLDFYPGFKIIYLCFAWEAKDFQSCARQEMMGKSSVMIELKFSLIWASCCLSNRTNWSLESISVQEPTVLPLRRQDSEAIEVTHRGQMHCVQTNLYNWGAGDSLPKVSAIFKHLLLQEPH